VKVGAKRQGYERMREIVRPVDEFEKEKLGGLHSHFG
jgi:hypothetical protein